jgi:hypothetical protein
MPIARVNDHDMFYEVLGHGDPVLCIGGWGTFRHENHGHMGAWSEVREQGSPGRDTVSVAGA